MILSSKVTANEIDKKTGPGKGFTGAIDLIEFKRNGETS